MSDARWKNWKRSVHVSRPRASNFVLERQTAKQPTATIRNESKFLLAQRQFRAAWTIKWWKGSRIGSTCITHVDVVCVGGWLRGVLDDGIVKTDEAHARIIIRVLREGRKRARACEPGKFRYFQLGAKLGYAIFPTRTLSAVRIWRLMIFPCGSAVLFSLSFLIFCFLVERAVSLAIANFATVN